MSSTWGISRAAINTGYGVPKSYLMTRGGETVYPWLPADLDLRKKVSTTRGRGMTLKKGSPEAKAHMAYLRSLRGNGRTSKIRRTTGGRRPRRVIDDAALEGGSDFWDSYTNAALLGGSDMDWDTYTNAALRGGDETGDALSSLFNTVAEVASTATDGGTPNASSFWNLADQIGPALQKSLYTAATKEGQAALNYVANPENLEKLIGFAKPKIFGALKRLWKRITGAAPDENDDPMGYLRYLKKNNPAAYQAKIREIRSTSQ